MQLYKNFCKETFNGDNVLNDFSLVYSENYNFDYDVIDETVRQAPNDTAVVWYDTEGREKTFTFEDISKPGAKAAIDFSTELEKASDCLERVSTCADEPMLIYFTSDTTGYHPSRNPRPYLYTFEPYDAVK